ncbi:uncharacterized protein LOC132383743 [Hypanus sabinus]|uniref:uncharacterized protein LOC132383743 n=1 Tax=Hypanus sabinus TaxID=79690 RepID=UPI0028C37CC9|nr:uncharacterized protein LOC132383743 [Hypanus sabinus]
MTETAPAETAPPAAPAAAKKTPKKKAAARSKPTGPSLGEQIDKIVAGCHDRKGMSGAAIMKALADSGVDVAKRRHQVKMSIKRKVESGSLVQAKGSGISGSFKSGKGKTAVKVVKKANKPAAKKSPSKKLGAKKPAAKKAAAKKPAAKKAAAKKPAAKKLATKAARKSAPATGGEMPDASKPAPKKGAMKALSKPASKSGKKRKRTRKESYAIYIYKVMKQVHPDTGISSRAMSIMNSFVNDIFERIAGEASRLTHYNRRSTISSREIQTAVRLLLPGELAKHAVSEGTKAVTKYTSSK